MPDSSPPHLPLTVGQEQALLDIARRSIACGLTTGRPGTIEPATLDEVLREPRATFVTLERGGALRGCIGTLEATRPLAEDVAASAYSAAFRDPRFPPLTADEVHDLDLHISILSPPEPIPFADEADLLANMRVGVDGLILEDGPYRGTFLPSVWESLPQVDRFWTHLKMKAGLPPNHWSPTLRVSRYTCQSVYGHYRPD